MGSGRVVGEAIVKNPKVDGVSFTGSVGVGRQIAINCVTRQAKVQLEMGGKNRRSSSTMPISSKRSSWPYKARSTPPASVAPPQAA